MRRDDELDFGEAPGADAGGSRDDGMARADIAVGLLVDAKMLKLQRAFPDLREAAIATLMYIETLLKSWEEGRRLTLEEAEAMWPGTPEHRAKIMEVRLVDAEGRIPAHAWERHHGPAARRLNQRRAAGRAGGLKRGKSDVVDDEQPPTDREPTTDQSEGDRQATGKRPPTQPASPLAGPPANQKDGRTDPQGSDSVRATLGGDDAHPSKRNGKSDGNGDGDAWSGFGPEWRPFRAAWAKKGLKKPPSVDQLPLIEDLVKARPEDVAFAIDTMPLVRAGSFEVIAWIREKLA